MALRLELSSPRADTESASKGALWQASSIVAQELVRSGYAFGFGYPGSPTTLVTRELEKLARRGLVDFRWATNEKIAFEMSAAVALSGGHSFAIMKHVGLNVALDAAMALAYSGHRGSLLLIVGDDPSCDSSQYEQDSRLSARMLGIPCLEPAAAHDVPSAIELATRISVETAGLVMLRLTTSLCHSSSVLHYVPVQARSSPPALALPRSDLQFLLTPAVARASGPRWLARLEAARVIGEGTHEDIAGARATPAFVVQNAIVDRFLRVCRRRGVLPPFWHSQMAWPIPSASLGAFLARHDTVVVLEEMEPLLEEQAVLLAYRQGTSVKIEGAGLRPRVGLVDEDALDAVIARFAGGTDKPPRARTVALSLPQRPPTFCAGCPHTASFYALKQVIEARAARPFVASDIGCYTLGTKAGIELGDTVLCMGASIGVAAGAALSGQRGLALIGDSTFLHAGLPALKNAVDLGVDLLVCILDNGMAAMTGGQAVPTIELESLARIATGLGAATVEVANPFEHADVMERVDRLLSAHGVSVLILRSPCALHQPAKPQRPQVDLDACTACGDCTTKIHCPAISLTDARKFQVNLEACVGCGLCSTICPEHALTPVPYP